ILGAAAGAGCARVLDALRDGVAAGATVGARAAAGTHRVDAPSARVDCGVDLAVGDCPADAEDHRRARQLILRVILNISNRVPVPPGARKGVRARRSAAEHDDPMTIEAHILRHASASGASPNTADLLGFPAQPPDRGQGSLPAPPGAPDPPPLAPRPVGPARGGRGPRAPPPRGRP